MGSEVEVEGAEVEGARQAAPEELVGLPPSQRGQETSVTSAFECSSSGTDLPLHPTWRPRGNGLSHPSESTFSSDLILLKW